MLLFLLLFLACFAMAQQSSEEEIRLPVFHQTMVITATPVEPRFERRNAEVFRQTLFSRDDQVFQLVAAGIDAGQHEGGGKSIEIRRFGFNLDHGGVNGGRCGCAPSAITGLMAKTRDRSRPAIRCST
jgi:hypothetical protein